MKKQS